MNDVEMNNIADRLQPHQVRNEPGVRVPSCYRVVDAPKVRPDVWIKDPMKSIVLKVRDPPCKQAPFLQFLCISSQMGAV